MSEIFISYARGDRDQVERLAAALENEGLAVWWDRHIAGGAAFSEEIVRELSAAKAVVVAWSEASVKSRWVMDEAATAADEGKLIPIALDAVEAPMGFKQLQVLDFSKWRGEKEAAAFQDLKSALRRRLESEAAAVSMPSSLSKQKRTPPALLLASAAAAIMVALLAAFAFSRGGGSAETGGTTAAAPASEASIAVLPFADMSAGGDQEYFADGISEELLNSLAGVDALKVAGRTSSFAFKGKNEDLRQIGQVLGVAHILEGSVRKSGDRVRITAQLIKADDGFHLWSETYDRELDDIFAVQDEIAAEIVSALTARLSTDAPPPPQTARADVDAYGLYLQAKELIRARKTDTLERAEGLLDRAIEIDPDYAPAHAARGLTESLLSDAPGAYGRKPIAEALPVSKAYAERAVELDPDHPDGHAVLGLAYLDSGETDLAIASLKRAVMINPNHLDARNWLSLTYGANGRYRDVAELQEKLFELDPLYRPGATNVVTQLLNVGEYNRARAILERLKEIDVAGDLYAWSLATYLTAEGKVAEAINIATPVYDQNPDTNRGGSLSFSHLRIGDAEGVRKFDLPFVEIYARMLEGRPDDALALAKEMLDENPEYYAARADYLVALGAAGEYEALADYYRATWSGPAHFQETMFQAFQGELPPFASVAFALKKAGAEDEFDAIMSRWRTAIDFARAGGAGSDGWDREEGHWHALAGESDAAIEFYERAGVRSDGLHYFHFGSFGPSSLLRGDPRFDAMVARNRERINEERALLGLPPAKFGSS